ncbi:MAG: hypothetical protein JWO45_1508, partial [Spartobacteria bacterium]|nr:hypothetical protein [Spartobacteria bacterium]
MKKYLLILVLTPALASAQVSPAPAASNSSPGAAADMEIVRQQVQSLNEAVKTLQQQVKNQQAVIEKANLGRAPALPENAESPVAANGSSVAPAGSPPSLFPTEDESVVTSKGTASGAPASGPNASSATTSPGTFSTTDSSVVATTSADTISSSGTGAALTQPLSIGGSKNYMNISLDGLFALA